MTDPAVAMWAAAIEEVFGAVNRNDLPAPDFYDGPLPDDAACMHPGTRCECDQAADYYYRNEVC